MKKLFYSLAALFALTAVGCVKEDDAGKEPPLVYIDVPVSVGEDDGSPDTKSLVSIEVEDFHKAALFAFKASDHKILPSQTGGPLTLTTEEKTFSWSLPVNTEMNIYVLCNYGDMDLSNYLSNANLTESDLQALKFSCASGTELQKLAQDGYGLPMAGVAENQVVNAQNNSLNLKVKKLFSRYDIYFDKSDFENKGYTINALYISASKSNTEVPYFVEGFKQTELSKLSLVDLGTPADIENLNQGDKTHAVTLYFLENCQGTKSGASKWYEVAGSSMEGLNLCSYVDIGIKATDADGNDANFFYWVYLGTGSGACVSDFNVTRNEKHTLKLTLKTPDEIPATKGIVFTQKDQTLIYNQTPQGSSFAKYASFYLPFETNLTSSETTYEIVGFENYNTQIGSAVFSNQNISVREKSGGSMGGSNETKYPNEGTLSFRVACSNARVYNNPLTLRIGKKTGDSWVVYDECFVMINIAAPSYKSRITKMVIDPSTVSVGGSATATVYGGTYNTMLNSITNESTRAAYMFDWSSSDTSVATVDGNGTVSGISDGYATITAVLKTAYATDYESPYTSAVESVTVGSIDVIENWLEVSGETTASVGETIYLTAKYYTSTNGVSDGGVDVTDEASWSVTGDASVSDGAVTSSVAGTFRVQADYNGESGSKYVTFTASTTPPNVTWRMKSLSITPSTIQVGGSTTSYSAIKEKYVDGVASGETADADVTGWSSDDTSIATVSGGTVTGVAAGTANITATDSSCETGYTTADASVTVTAAPPVDAFDHYEYENVNVSIWSTVNNNFPVGGTSYTIKATASATRYEVWTVSGRKATGETVTTTPHISGGGGAFTSIDEDSSSVDCSVGANTGAQRSAEYSATAKFGEGSYEKSGSASCTVIQEAYVNPDDFEWIDTSISMDTDGSSVTASFKSSGYPSFDKTTGIDLESPSYDSGSKTGSVKISISNPASFSDGDNSASVTGSCGTASDVLDITVHKPVFTYHKKVITTLSSSTIQWSEYSYASATLYTTTYRDGVNKGTTSEDVTSSGFTAYTGIFVKISGNRISAASNTESSIGSVNIKSDYRGADEYEDAVLTIEKKQYYIPITVSEDGSGGYEIVVDEYNDGYGADLPCSVTLTFEFTDGVKPTVTLSAGQKYATFTPLGSGSHGNLESVTLDPSSYDDHCEHYTFSVSF